jgi:hypothetical protein
VLLLGTVVGGRFGYAIAKARDLNADTFDGMYMHECVTCICVTC